ncbi:hypothetical protein VTN96DRAFT_9877 [Rasamsonia emersonii]
MVWMLPISNGQKVLVLGIFMLGILTFIFDVIQLVALIDLASAGDDVTYNQVASSVWTSIEPAVGIMAACLTNMRPLFKAAYKRLGYDRCAEGTGSSTPERLIREYEKRNRFASEC